ncbi:MAG: hypothetical protein GVY26_22150 [Bacteroidetes bacterium]|jgi:hypothetical protein|nr:hypothetical protein [Bacteroidota bacterium]
MKNRYAIIGLTILLSASMMGCGNEAESRLHGSWENLQGHVYTFKPGGEMSWIYPSGASSDTFNLQYTYDGSTQPNTLDFYGFKSGPFQGATLYGIVKFIDFEGKEVIRCNFNRGQDASARPEEFLARRRTMYMRQEYIDEFREKQGN